MALPFYIEHGNRSHLLLAGREIAKRQRGLDTLRQSIRTDREDSFSEGGVVPGFPHMRLKEVVSRQDGPGWIHEMNAEGLRRGPHKLESSSLAQPEEGWDEGPQTWLTIRPDDFAIGAVHPDHPNIWCVGKPTIEDINGHVWRVSCDYKGIILDGDSNPKPGKLKVTVNGQAVNTSGNVTLGHYTPEIFTDENGVFDGWTTARKGSFDTSKVNIVWTALSLTPPPTERVGMQKTPPRVPVTVSSIFDNNAWYSSSGFTYNYPAGWKLASVQADQVLDKSVWLYTLTFEYNPIAVPIL